MRKTIALCWIWAIGWVGASGVVAQQGGGYPIVDTGQVRCYDDARQIAYPQAGQAYFGQDAQYVGHAPSYKDNGDGTISDQVTGLMWTADPGDKVTWAGAMAGARTCRVGGHDDWRLPSIQELYSLILFTGEDPDPRARNTDRLRPFIDTRYFKFEYGDPDQGDRVIDSQFATSTRYVSTTMGGNATMFGVNFADGRIKGYPTGAMPGRGAKTYFALYVRGNPKYGRNDFVDNGDGTVTDRATGLTWMQVDSGHLRAGKGRDGKFNWQEALAWAEGLEYAGKDDWRLPNAKELQSLVDYSRSPATTGSAAIDPVFRCSKIALEENRKGYGFYWTSTTHARADSGAAACYVAFGEALGYMQVRGSRRKRLLDVHGAGAQRSDPKSGDPSKLGCGHGPQGDVQRIYNLVRCVRGGNIIFAAKGPRWKLRAETDQATAGRVSFVAWIETVTERSPAGSSTDRPATSATSTETATGSSQTTRPRQVPRRGLGLAGPDATPLFQISSVVWICIWVKGRMVFSAVFLPGPIAAEIRWFFRRQIRKQEYCSS